MVVWCSGKHYFFFFVQTNFTEYPIMAHNAFAFFAHDSPPQNTGLCFAFMPNRHQKMRFYYSGPLKKPKLIPLTHLFVTNFTYHKPHALLSMRKNAMPHSLIIKTKKYSVLETVTVYGTYPYSIQILHVLSLLLRCRNPCFVHTSDCPVNKNRLPYIAGRLH